MASLLDYLGYAGNMLDLPGSSLRDILSGRNPFDQWATPFSGDNRATGRDVLNPIFGANKETGMSGWLDDPWEGVKDLAGFGLEVVADPLNLIPAGALSKVLKGRKAARGVNTAIDAVAASPARARLAAELAKGFGEEAAAPTMKALDAFVLKNKMKPDDVYGKMSVGDAVQNPVPLGDQQLMQPNQSATNTPEFKNWFGDWEADPVNASKVVDGTGKPLTVYHGTGADFDEFSTSKAGGRDSGYFGKGFYFSDKPVSAEMYAGTGDWFTPNHKPNIKPVHLALKNPLITTPADLRKYGWKIGPELTDAIKADGYDGAIITHESGLKEYLAFDPTQIKSVFNRGTYDPANPNTLYQSPVPEVPAFYSKIAELVDKNKLPKMVSQSTLLKRLSESGISKEEIGDVSKSIDDLFSEEEFKHPEWGNNGDFSVGQEFVMPPATGPKNPMLSDGLAAQLFGTPVPMSRGEFKIPSQKIKELMEDTIVPKLQVTELSANALKKNAAERSATRQAINDMAAAARQEEPYLSTGRYSEEFLDQAHSLDAEVTRLDEEWGSLGPQYEGQHSLRGGVPDTYREMLIKRPDVGPFAGNHFRKHEGVLAHVRMDDIEIPGGGKTLRIQEVQSDLHQKARKLGYQKEYDPNIKAEVVPLKVQPRIEVQDHAEWSSMRDLPYAVIMPGGRKRFFDTMEEAEQAIASEGHDVVRVKDTDGTLLKEITKIDLPGYLRWNGPTPSELQLHNISGWVQETANKGKMPDAPFKESWTRLALKKVLDTAAKEGYDSVAVASGKDITKAVAGADPPEDVLKALTLWNEKTIPDHLNKMIVKQGGTMEKVSQGTRVVTNTTEGAGGTAVFRFYTEEDFEPMGEAVRSLAGDEFFVRDFDGRRRSFSTLDEARTYATRNHPEAKNGAHELTVFHLPPALKQTILEKGQPLYKKNRGMVSFGEDGSSLINPINPDFSTAPHEVSHVMRRMLGGEQAGKAADIFGGSSGGWSREAEESFAQGAEAYFQNASTTSPGMQQSLQQMNRGFAGVYDNPIQTRDGGTEFFRDILGITENSSPLDRQRIPGIVGPVAAGAAYNAIARYNPRGGVQ